MTEHGRIEAATTFKIAPMLAHLRPNQNLAGGIAEYLDQLDRLDEVFENEEGAVDGWDSRSNGDDAALEIARHDTGNGGSPHVVTDEKLQDRPAQTGNGQITHDKAMASTFLTQLDPTATRFTFQTFDDDKDRKNKALVRVLHGTLDECFAELTRLNKAGAGVFVTISETNFLGRSTKNIVRPRALFYDADGDEQVVHATTAITECDAPPSLKVESGGGKHGYYICDDIPLDQFSALQKSLATKLGTDPIPHDLPRVMRLPGMLHLKDPSKPRLVKLVATDGALRRWKLSDLIDKLGLSATTPDRTNGNGEPPPRPEIADALKHLKPQTYLAGGIEYPTADIEEIRSAASAIPVSAITNKSEWMDFARALAWEAKMRPERYDMLWEILDTTSRGAPKYDPRRQPGAV